MAALCIQQTTNYNNLLHCDRTRINKRLQLSYNMAMDTTAGPTCINTLIKYNVTQPTFPFFKLHVPYIHAFTCCTTPL